MVRLGTRCGADRRRAGPRRGRRLDILLRLDELRQQAAKAGGEVVCLVGNHEIMNYEGDFRYVSGDWGDGFLALRSQIGAALDDF